MKIGRIKLEKLCLLIDWLNNLYGARLKCGRKNFRLSGKEDCNSTVAAKLKNSKYGIYFHFIVHL